MSHNHELFEIVTEGNVLAVAFKAPYVNDTRYLEELEDGLRDLLAHYDQRFLLVDFSEVELIVSRMINSLLLMVKRVRADGGQVHLSCLDTKIERVFKTMKLDRVFDMHDTREDGLAVLKALENKFRMAQFA